MESDQSHVKAQIRRIHGISKERESFLSGAGPKDGPGDGFHPINTAARTRLPGSGTRNSSACLQGVVSEERCGLRIRAGEQESGMPHSRAEASV